MNSNKGILLDTDYNLQISVKRDKNGLILRGVKIGDTTDQNVALVLSMQPGDLKELPLAGGGLSRFVRGKYNSSQVESHIRKTLGYVGIDYDSYKDRLQANITTKEQ